MSTASSTMVHAYVYPAKWITDEMDSVHTQPPIEKARHPKRAFC